MHEVRPISEAGVAADEYLAQRAKLAMQICEAVHRRAEEAGMTLSFQIQGELYELTMAILKNVVLSWSRDRLPKLHSILAFAYKDPRCQVWDHIAIFDTEEDVQKRHWGEGTQLRTRYGRDSRSSRSR